MTTETKVHPASSGAKKERTVHPVSQRAQAVLSIWTERRRPTEVCRELGITTALLADWQERAIRGMLAALEPRRGAPTERSPALTSKLERLLHRQAQASETKLLKLDQRLAKLQQAPASTASAKDK